MITSNKIHGGVYQNELGTYQVVNKNTGEVIGKFRVKNAAMTFLSKIKRNSRQAMLIKRVK